MKFLLLNSVLVCLGAFSSMAGAQAQVIVAVTLNPAGDFKAQTGTVTGFATATKEGVAAENITVDTRTLKTGMSLRDQHLQKTLQSEKFPFVKLLKASGKDGKGTGTIEVKGIKTEVSGTYKIEGNLLAASFKMHMPDVKISDINYMGVGVEDDIMINVKVPIKAAAAVAAPAPATKAAVPVKAAPAPTKKK